MSLTYNPNAVSAGSLVDYFVGELAKANESLNMFNPSLLGDAEVEKLQSMLSNMHAKATEFHVAVATHQAMRSETCRELTYHALLCEIRDDPEYRDKLFAHLLQKMPQNQAQKIIKNSNHNDHALLEDSTSAAPSELETATARLVEREAALNARELAIAQREASLTLKEAEIASELEAALALTSQLSKLEAEREARETERENSLAARELVVISKLAELTQRETNLVGSSPKSKKSTKPPGSPKSPKTAYNIYCELAREDVVRTNPGVKGVELTRLIAAKFKAAKVEPGNDLYRQAKTRADALRAEFKNQCGTHVETAASSVPKPREKRKDLYYFFYLHTKAQLEVARPTLTGRDRVAEINRLWKERDNRDPVIRALAEKVRLAETETEPTFSRPKRVIIDSDSDSDDEILILPKKKPAFKAR